MNQLNYKLYSIEECFEKAKTCKSIKEFHDKYYSFYMSSRHHNIMSRFTWFATPKATKYTKDVCFNVAKKYKYLKDFREHSPSEYNKACKMGWLKDYNWLIRYIPSKVDIDLNNHSWCVYVYIIQEQYVYVGLTLNIKRRHYEHTKRKTDKLFRFCKENEFSVPEYTILKDNLSAKDAQYYEDFYIKEYKNNKKYKVLNIGKTGTEKGSIGNFSGKIWTEESCIDLAMQCKTLKEFKRRSSRAYTVSRDLGILKTFTWLERTVLTKETAKLKTPLLAFDIKTNKFIKEFDKTIDILNFIGKSELKKLPSNIYACCKGKLESAYGYIWKYKDLI